MQRTLLFVLVAASYLLFAGGPRWALAVLLCLAVAARLLPPARARDVGRRSRGLDVALLAALAGITVQLVPIPPEVLPLLSPHAWPLRAAVQLAPPSPAPGVMGAPGLAVPLTVDGGATVWALANVTLVLLAYRAGRAVFDREGGVRRFCRTLAWLAALAALSAIVLRQATPQLVLGLLHPEAAGARPFGAFVNRNHFAGWLMMAAPVVAGYLIAHVRHHLGGERDWRVRLRHATRSRALPLAAALSCIVMVLLLTLSRSAVVGLGVAAAAGWLMSRSRLETSRPGRLAAVGVLGLAVAGAATLANLEAWGVRLESTLATGDRPGDRVVIWRETLPLVRDFWLAGTGAGTYGTAKLAYQESRIWVPHLNAWAHFNQAHNHYLQVVAEGGLLLALPLAIGLAALAAAAGRALRADRTELFWVRAGAAASLAGVAAQSLWEVPLTMPANGVLAAVLTSVLLHDRGKREEKSEK